MMTVVNIYDAKTQHRKLKFGVLKGKIKISKNLDAPLLGEVLGQFEGL
jgi:hypothetical protein